MHKYLATHSLLLKPFCEARGLSYYQVMRLLNGKTNDMSLQLAHALQRATGGTVKMPTWLYHPRRPHG